MKGSYTGLCSTTKIGPIPICLFCIIVLTSTVPPFWAQTAATGALDVTVTDATGATVPGATVIVNNGAGLNRSLTTNAQGIVSVPLLPPGDYKITISASGFKTSGIPVVAVHVTETASVNQSLEVGTQEQQVEVSAQAQALETDSAALGGVVNSAAITGIPLSTRNYTQILNLSAGVNTPVTNASSVGLGLQAIYVNGQTNTNNAYQMDGININGYGEGDLGSTIYGNIAIPSPDALEEFKVQTSNYDASYGRNTGSTVNIVTKSGTNAIHGTLFEFLRNDDLNSNLFFANLNGQPRGELRQNQFGGTVGGPIRKDKLFLFLSYQGTRQLNAVAINSGNATVSLPATLTNDRSAGALGAAFCPQNNPAGSPGYSYSHTFLGGAPAFPNNQVNCEGSNISPVALALLNYTLPGGGYLIPSPQTISNPGTQQALGQGFYASPASYNENQALGNLDYTISAKQTLALKYYYEFAPTILPFQGAQPLGGGEKTFSGNNSIVGKHTTVITSHLVNEARVSDYYIRGEDRTLYPVTTSAIGMAPSSSFNPVAPLVTINGLFTIGGSQFDANLAPEISYEWSDQMSWVHGRHNIRFGYDEQHIIWNDCSCGKTRGVLTFQSWADFLLGESAAQNGTSQSNVNASNASIQPFSTPNLIRSNQFNFFAQDDFKINRRLTLNLGLRWEYDGTAHDVGTSGGTDAIWSLLEGLPIPPASGTFVGYSVAKNYAGPPLPPGVVTRPEQLYTNGLSPLHDFAPRFGFAWQPPGTGDRLVVRGGYGWFWQVVRGGVAIDTADGNPPLSAPLSYSGTANAPATFANPWNPAVVPGSWAPFIRTPTSSLTMSALDPNLSTPLTMAWNYDMQYAIRPDLILDIAYVGNRSLHMITQDSLNVPQLATATTPVNCGAPGGCIATNTAANAAQRVPVLGVGPGGFRLATNAGDANYNALDVTLRKKFGASQIQGAYTWGKCLTDVIGSSTASAQGGSVNNDLGYNNRKLDYGECAYDRPQRLVVNYVYQLPNYRNNQGLAGKVLSGWGLSGVITIQKGSPLTFYDTRAGAVYGNAGNTLANTTVTNNGLAQLCPGITYGQIVTSGSVESRLNGYVNVNAFCAPPVIGVVNGVGGATGYGNSGQSVVLGPGQDNWDIAILKRTVVGGIHENAYLEFRSEFFNVFNHPQFSNPGTTVNAASLGVITSETVGPRVIQFGLKYAF